MPLVEVSRLVKRFPKRSGLFTRDSFVTALNDVSFAIEDGDTFGLVGESGSGKTTAGRCILRLIEPTAGAVLFRGENVLRFNARQLRALRRSAQIVFQDPYSSLNPRMTAGQMVREPLVIHRVGTVQEQADRVRELFQLVGLDPIHERHYPHQFSGGQRQRIGLARALALSPSFLVLDEPVSALDVSVQGQIINLLLELQRSLKLTYLFITHDLRLVNYICNKTAVMYRGAVVEMGATSSIFAAPVHPYTQTLLSSIPAMDQGASRPRFPFDPANFPPGSSLTEVRPAHWAAI
jgi:ABC-type oligopeptide transport system ATPase subunit